MASSIGPRRAVTRIGSALISAASRAGSAMRLLAAPARTAAPAFTPSRLQPRLQVGGQRARPARVRQLARAPTRGCARAAGRARSVAAPSRAMASRSARRRGVDQAAFDAAGGDDELARLTRQPSTARWPPTSAAAPAKRLRKCSLQPTSKPQFDGCSGASVDAARLQPAAPRRRRSPAAASWRRPAPARWPAAHAAARPAASRSAARRRRPSPASGGACASARPARAAGAARRAAAARPSCRSGNTRPELPTKVSMPSAARPVAQRRRRRSSRSSGASARRARAIARRRRRRRARRA